jgi:hypothetical protein
MSKNCMCFATISDLLEVFFKKYVFLANAQLKYSCWRKLAVWILEDLQLKLLISEIQGNNYQLLQKWMENSGMLLLGFAWHTEDSGSFFFFNQNFVAFLYLLEATFEMLTL